MVPISVCIIAKNEEKFIRGCLEHLMPYGFEIVVVDTGSTDKTKEIALEFTEHVYDFEWIDDFSAARNFATSKASNDWILSIDCDEFLQAFNVAELLKSMHSYPHSSGLINQCNWEEDDISYTRAEIYRFYPKLEFHYEKKIHEQLLRIDNMPATSYHTGISVYHYGYRQDQVNLEKKNWRNISLLLKMIEEEPDNPYYYYQLGKSYSILGDNKQGLAYYTKATEYDLDPNTPYVQDLIYSYGQSLLLNKEYETALGLEGIRDDFKHIPEYIYLMGLIYAYNGQLLKAISEMSNALQMQEECQILDGVTSYRAYYQLGVFFHKLNQNGLAIYHLKKAGEYSPALALLFKLQQ